MANYGALMAFGKGMSAAGQAFDRNFQLQMEQMRQQSLERLESRRLDIAEGEAADNKAWREGSLKLQAGESFDKSKQQFQERMDKMAEQIIAELPGEQSKEMMARVMKQLMGDPNTLLQYTTDTGELDGEKLGKVINSLTSSLDLPGEMDRDQAKRAIDRFARAMVKNWNGIQKRFPEYASEMTPMDVINNIPAFYKYIGEGPEPMPSYDGTSSGDYANQQVARPSNTRLFADIPGASQGRAAPAPSGQGLMSRVADEGGLVSPEGFKAGYEGVSRAMFQPWFEELETGAYANPRTQLLPQVPQGLMNLYNRAEQGVSRFLFGDELGGMTRGPDGMLRYPGPNVPGPLNLDPGADMERLMRR